MAAILRIKRSETGGNPAVLAAGELAYSGLIDNGSNGGDRLYIGMGTETTGNAANHVVIGGKYFTDMLDHAKGTLTSNSALIVDASSKLDNLKIDNIDINGNTISSTDTNGNIVLTPNGTGYVNISGTNGVVIPSGTVAQRGPSTQGTIRYNTDTSQFEGYSGTNWSSLGGVRSVDGYTYIIAESSPGASDGILHFYAKNPAGTAALEVAQLDKTKLSLLQTTTSTSTSTGAIVVAGGAGIAENLHVGGNIVVTGNLTINGTTTTVNSTTTTVSDPIFTLGGSTAPTEDDSGKDRGIEFRWWDPAANSGAGAAKIGFFGFDKSTGYFTFIPSATNTSEVFTGDKGILDIGGITGTASAWTTGRTVTFAGGDVTGSFTISGTADIGNVNLTAATASSSAKGIASFSPTYFTVTSGDVAINDATTSTKGIASFNSNMFSLTSGAVSIVDASTTVKGIASFDSTNFTVTNGAVVLATIDGGTF